MLFLDLDRFKLVNDSLGHHAGDELLKALSGRLRACVRAGDTVARFGGDEFTILLEDIQGTAEIMPTLNELMLETSRPFEIQGHELQLSASVGVVFHRGGRNCSQDVLRDADIAMYRAKGEGKGRYAFFEASMREHAGSALTLERDLRRALKHNELRVHYQPIVSTDTEALVGFEALVRWDHPERGSVPPAAFIRAAEENGLIVDIDHWVLDEACRQLAAWHDMYPQLGSCVLSVNFSSQHFGRDDLAMRVAQALERSGLPAERLRIELTESTLMGDSEQVAEALANLKARGVRLHLDDFGTGYSSLSYLQRFPIDALKIDRAFIAGLTTRPESDALVHAIIEMARGLDLEVVAEGVETAEQLERLKRLRCPHVQGYLVSPPLTAADAEAWLAHQAARAAA